MCLALSSLLKAHSLILDLWTNDLIELDKSPDKCVVTLLLYAIVRVVYNSQCRTIHMTFPLCLNMSWDPEDPSIKTRKYDPETHRPLSDAHRTRYVDSSFRS